MDDILIASFDIGKVNFAFCIEKFSIEQLSKSFSFDSVITNGSILSMENARLTSSEYCFKKLFVFLEQRKQWWQQCHIFLIEKQLKKANFNCQIAFHLEAYLKTCWPFKKVVMFSSIHKTRIFQKKRVKYFQRKQLCIEKTILILTKRQDHNSISSLLTLKKRMTSAIVFAKYKLINGYGY